MTIFLNSGDREVTFGFTAFAFLLLAGGIAHAGNDDERRWETKRHSEESSSLDVVKSIFKKSQSINVDPSNESANLELGNPLDIEQQYRADQEPREPTFSFTTLDEFLLPFDEFRDRMNNEEGLIITLSATHVFQGTTSSITDESMASGTEVLFQGNYTPFGFKTPSPSTFGWEVVAYNKVGTDIAPIALGGQAGSLWPSAVAFDEVGPFFGQFWFQQKFDNKIGFRVGRMFPVTAYDFFPLKNFRTDFLDGINSANLVIPMPASRGLGAFGMYKPVENVYIRVGINDANSDNFEPGWETLEWDETFKILEIGVDPGIEKRQPGRPPAGDVHLSLWQQDERKDAGVDDGWGVAFSASQRFGDYLPYFRYGFADGGSGGPSLLQHSVNFGLAIDNIVASNNDRFGISFSWARPANSNLDDQASIDMFYRHQLTKRVSMGPTFQYLINPVSNDDDSVVIGGLRTRFAF